MSALLDLDLDVYAAGPSGIVQRGSGRGRKDYLVVVKVASFTLAL